MPIKIRLFVCFLWGERPRIKTFGELFRLFFLVQERSEEESLVEEVFGE